ncbi:MAG: hypothetical protein ACLTQI_00765 [Slackia sp.]
MMLEDAVLGMQDAPSGDRPPNARVRAFDRPLSAHDGAEYWANGKLDEEACFHMFFRENPFKGGFAIACGAAQLAEMIDGFAFSDEDVAYLGSLQAPGGGPLFDEGFLAYLRTMRLTLDVDAVREGTVVFPMEPIVRVTGPILQCQLLETALLCCMNFQTLIATKAARVCLAAQAPVAEFGLRRAQEQAVRYGRAALQWWGLRFHVERARGQNVRYPGLRHTCPFVGHGVR